LSNLDQDSILEMSFSSLSIFQEAVTNSEAGETEKDSKIKKNVSISLTGISKYQIYESNRDDKDKEKPTNFDEIYSQIVNFIEISSKNGIENSDIHSFDVQSFLQALGEYKSTLEENRYLKSARTSLYNLCDVCFLMKFHLLILNPYC